MLEEREAELRAAIMASEQLEADLADVSGDLSEREAQLDDVQAAALAQADTAKAALQESQRKVGGRAGGGGRALVATMGGGHRLPRLPPWWAGSLGSSLSGSSFRRKFCAWFFRRPCRLLSLSCYKKITF